MMDAPTRAQEIKAVLSAIIAAIIALIGWQGILVIVWVFAMLLDYLTGSRAAMMAGEWSSKAAREGLWHKGGSIAIALVAAMLDISVRVIAPMGLGIELPWSGAVIFPLVVIWYILTETGSIVENAIKCGAPCPAWLRDKIKSAKDKLDEQQSSGHPPDGWETEHSASEDAEE